MQWINVVTNMKSKGEILPPKYFTIFNDSMSIANTLFYIYNGRMFVANTNTIIYIYIYIQCTKAITSVNSSNSFSSFIINNTLLATNIFIPLQKVRWEHLSQKKIIFSTKILGIFNRLILLLSQMF